MQEMQPPAHAGRNIGDRNQMPEMQIPADISRVGREGKEMEPPVSKDRRNS